LLKLYVAIDEDLKALQPQLDAKQLPHDPRGRMPLLSAAGVLPILVWGVWRGLKDQATLYFHVRPYQQRECPALGAYSKFVEATNRYSVELRALPALVLHRNRQAQGASPIVLQGPVSSQAICRILLVMIG
jgi:hypothetical protein